MKVFPAPKSLLLSDEPIAFQASFLNNKEIESLAFIAENLHFAQEGMPVNVSFDTSLSEQAYELKINRDGLSIKSADKAGLFYAVQSLSQIVKQADESIPEITISDSPEFKHRGYMLDISRCRVPQMNELKRIIDLLALLKFNELQLYTEHTFAYKNHKKVWKEASPFTAEEIKEIDLYCKERFIELIPNQNSMGHLERWFRHSEYQHLAECPEGFIHPISGEKKPFGSTITPGKDSLKFIDSLYEELLVNFSSKNLNVGCDEPWELGKGKSKDDADKRGKHQVYFSLLKEIQELVIKHGYNMYFWADILLEKPELINELDNVTGLIWGYEKGHPFDEQCAVFEKNKLPFYVVPGTSLWNTIGGRIDNCLDNIQEAVHYGLKYKAKGLLLTDWGDNGHHQPFVLSYPAIITAACLSWNPNQEVDVKDFMHRNLFSNESKNLVNCIYKLGLIPNHFSKKRINGTLLADILFAKKDQIKEVMEAIHYKELKAVERSLRKISRELIKEPTNCEYSKQCRAELLWVNEAFSFAHQKALYVARPNDFKNAKEKLDALCNKFEELWLKRSRKGGLKESLERLQQSLD